MTLRRRSTCHKVLGQTSRPLVSLIIPVLSRKVWMIPLPSLSPCGRPFRSSLHWSHLASMGEIISIVPGQSPIAITPLRHLQSPSQRLWPPHHRQASQLPYDTNPTMYVSFFGPSKLDLPHMHIMSLSYAKGFGGSAWKGAIAIAFRDMGSRWE